MGGCGEPKRRKPPPGPLTPAEQYMVSQGQDPRPQEQNKAAAERAALLTRYKLRAPREVRGTRFAKWLVGRVVYGQPRGHEGAYIWFHRTRVFLAWLLVLLVDKAVAYLAARFGGRVTRTEYNARQGHCHTCDTALRRAEHCKVDGKWVMVVGMYCLACRCGETPRARLDNKNWYRRWKCPLGKHAGSADWRELESECYVPPNDDDEPEVAEDGLADSDLIVGGTSGAARLRDGVSLRAGEHGDSGAANVAFSRNIQGGPGR